VGNASTHQESLEGETIDAHRAYLQALLTWERTAHEATCPHCGSKTMSAGDYERAIVAAEAHKEACRVRFRDLVDQLGYVPRREDLALPDERYSPVCGSRAN
jgi:rubredoxin